MPTTSREEGLIKFDGSQEIRTDFLVASAEQDRGLGGNGGLLPFPVTAVAAISLATLGSTFKAGLRCQVYLFFSDDLVGLELLEFIDVLLPTLADVCLFLICGCSPFICKKRRNTSFHLIVKYIFAYEAFPRTPIITP